MWGVKWWERFKNGSQWELGGFVSISVGTCVDAEAERSCVEYCRYMHIMKTAQTRKIPKRFFYNKHVSIPQGRVFIIKKKYKIQNIQKINKNTKRLNVHSTWHVHRHNKYMHNAYIIHDMKVHHTYSYKQAYSWFIFFKIKNLYKFLKNK